MESLTLSVVYTFSALVIHGGFLAVGFLLPYQAERSGFPRTIDLFLRWAMGMALVSLWLVSNSLLFGVGRHLLLLPILGAIIGCALGYREVLATGRIAIEGARSLWQSLIFPERIIASVLLILAGTFSLNVIIGSLAPDVTQDGVWYHTTLPQQWLLWGELAVYTHNMPSSYTLAADILYLIPAFFDESILANVIYGVAGLLTMALVSLVFMSLAGARQSWPFALLLPLLFAIVHLIAPIVAHQDLLAFVWFLAGIWILAKAYHGNSSELSYRNVAIAAFLFSTAASAKIVIAIYIIPFVLVYTAHGFLVRRPNTFRHFLVLGVVGLLVMVPWFIRAYLYHGNPFLHLSKSIFPINDEFLPLLRGYEKEPRFVPINTEGLRWAFTQGIRMKVLYASSIKDLLFLPLPILATWSLFSKKPFLKVCAISILSVYIFFPFMHGYSEMSRYFTLSYAPAVFLLGGGVPIVWSRLGRVSSFIIALFLTAGFTTVYTLRQWDVANYRTVNWDFLPKVTLAAQKEWGAGTENAWTLVDLREIGNKFPDGSLVVIEGRPGPTYLGHRAYWGDYSCGRVLDDWSKGRTSVELYAYMKELGITHFIISDFSLVPPQVTEMIDSGNILPMENDVNGWFLGRLR